MIKLITEKTNFKQISKRAIVGALTIGIAIAPGCSALKKDTKTKPEGLDFKVEHVIDDSWLIPNTLESLIDNALDNVTETLNNPDGITYNSAYFLPDDSRIMVLSYKPDKKENPKEFKYGRFEVAFYNAENIAGEFQKNGTISLESYQKITKNKNRSDNFIEGYLFYNIGVSSPVRYYKREEPKTPKKGYYGPAFAWFDYTAKQIFKVLYNPEKGVFISSQSQDKKKYKEKPNRDYKDIIPDMNARIAYA